MNNILIMIRKQMKDTFKNKAVLIQLVLLPVVSFILERVIRPEGVPELMYTKMFAAMYMAMAPLTAMSAIIAEEKEKNTLRVLMMSNVKPGQYLTGIGAYVWIISMIGSVLFAVSFPAADMPFFFLVMGVGFLISIVIGAVIGITAKNQMSAGSVGAMAMIILSFIPMFAMFNEGIGAVARFLYTQQTRFLLDAMSFAEIKWDGAVILAANAILAVVMFFVAFRKKGLE